MTHTERGLYITLLCLCWLEGSLPSGTDQLARLVAMPAVRFARLWAGVLSTCFQSNGSGRLRHKRLEEEREKQAQFKARAATGGRAKAAKPLLTDEPKQASSSAKRLLADEPKQTFSSAKSLVSDLQSPISDLQSPNVRTKTARARACEAGEPEDPEVPFATPYLPPAPPDDLGRRAAAFLQRYQALHVKHRHGAPYHGPPTLDFKQAEALCQTYADDRLDRIAIVFLTTDHNWISNNPRTIGRLAHMASWCDDLLRQKSL